MLCNMTLPRRVRLPHARLLIKVYNPKPFWFEVGLLLAQYLY